MNKGQQVQQVDLQALMKLTAQEQKRAGAKLSGKEKAAAKKAAKTDTPYLNGRVHYADRLLSISTMSRWLLVIILVQLVLIIGLTIVLSSEAMRSRYIPFVSMVDRHGVAIATGIAEPVYKSDMRVIVANVADVIIKSRTVTADIQLQRRNIFEVYAHLEDGSTAKAFMDNWFRASKPFERSATELVQVDVESVIAVADHVLQVQWNENVTDRTGKLLRVDSMRANLTWTEGAAPSPDTEVNTMILNPLGIYVTDVDWRHINYIDHAAAAAPAVKEENINAQ